MAGRRLLKTQKHPSLKVNMYFSGKLVSSKPLFARV
jgi:hypothetical protein